MATYKQIANDVKIRTGKTVKSCWIAHVKSIHGLTKRLSPNRINRDSRVYPCPDKWMVEIEISLKKFGDIS